MKPGAVSKKGTGLKERYLTDENGERPLPDIAHRRIVLS